MAGIIESQMALFVGPQAATWDWNNYAKAELMRLNGEPALKILESTGIFWGPDGKPRMEVDDSGAKVTGQSGTIGKALDHEALYQAYPALRDLPADVAPNGMFDSAYEGAYTIGPNGERIAVKADRAEMKGVILHEIQHAIQQREGFAAGGLPDGTSLLQVQIDREASQRYLRKMGEVEARAAAARQGMSAEQRRKVHPEKSYDVPIDKLTR